MTNIVKSNYSLLYYTTTAGFEPARAEPSGFQVHLLNHSDMLSSNIHFLLLFKYFN